jgi:exodeoxyribonuclease VII large subunit
MQEDFDFSPPDLTTTSSHDLGPSWNAPLSVSQLNLSARQLIERGIPLLWVAGEISNFTRSASGHSYFSLKDERAQVRCVMFRSRMQSLDWQPVSGMQVEVRASPTLYEARGEFQLTVEFMRRAGLGALYEAFAHLKARLEQEGLFDALRKKPIPAFPRRVGVITSTAAAALRDVLTTLRRRMPSMRVIVYPTPVQGEGAAKRIAAVIDLAAARRECDVLIVCRGGGSIEDLWAFNDEAVARALTRCTIPVVCGIGHETDYTIADFAADARAPTPTAAAELVSPDARELRSRIAVLSARVGRMQARLLERRMQQLDYLARRLVHPGERIETQRQHVFKLGARMARAMASTTQETALRLELLQHRAKAVAPDLGTLLARHRTLARHMISAAARNLGARAAVLEHIRAQLYAFDPQRVLERGYSLIHAADGSIVRDAQQLRVGDEVSVTFAHGGAAARIEDTRS